MNVLSDEVVRFVSGPVALLAACRDEHLEPWLSRAVGLRVSPDRTSLTVYLTDRPAASLRAVVAPGRPFAVTATSVPTHRSVQFKGTVTAVRPAREDERPHIEFQAGGFTDDLVALGFAVPVVRRLATWPATAVEVRVEAAFVQTPGPGAGRPVGSA